MSGPSLPLLLPLLLQILRRPPRMATLGAPEWELLLRQAGAAGLSATLCLLAEEHGLADTLPPSVRRRLGWARTAWERHVQAVHFELTQVRRALLGSGLPLILLKGTAYLTAGLPAASGRIFSDIDILVPKERLGEVESRLMLHGWASAHMDAYDQRYYREWMHELPPMQHMRRGSAIDVHHAILPQTAARRPDPARLRAAARPAGMVFMCWRPATWSCTVRPTCFPKANTSMAYAACSTCTGCCATSARSKPVSGRRSPGGRSNCSWSGRCSTRCAIARGCWAPLCRWRSSMRLAAAVYLVPCWP
jgi:hypothetical protein